MRRFLPALLTLCALCLTLAPLSAADFIRGDANGDGEINIVDAVIAVLVFVDQLTPDQAMIPVAINCEDAVDANDDGVLDLQDAVFLIQVVVLPDPPMPSAPFPDCGPDPTDDDLGCDGPVAACP